MSKQKCPRQIYQMKWAKNPKETCPKDEEGNNRNITCFVPSCSNRMWYDGKKNRRLIFFKVPDGMDGLWWTKSIRKIGAKKYKHLVNVVTGPQNESTNSHNSQYCCEAHFDITQDIEQVVRNDGYVEYKIKTGVLPSVQRRQTERLVHMNRTTGNVFVDSGMKNEIVLHDESMADENTMYSHDPTKSTNESSTNDFPTIVDAFTLNEEPSFEAPHDYYEIRSLDDDDEQQTEIKCEPILEMLPLTIALMKRKSLHYMGLKADRLERVFKLARRQRLSEMRVMLTLRKLRLKEDFETLGDLFDLDKTTTEKYYNQCKYRVSEFVGKLITTSAVKCDVATESVIKMEEDIKPKPSRNGDTNEMNKNDELSSAVSDFSGYDSAADPDIKVAKLGPESCTSEDYSDRSYNEQKHFLNLFRRCGLCFEKFETATLLKVHQEKIHRGGFQCDLCGRKYMLKKSIKRHILMVHAKVRYLRHRKSVHAPKCNVKCNSCDMKFVDLETLESHVRAKHTYKAPFKCKVKDCGKTFIKECYYKAHERSHAEDKFVCDICSKEFHFKPYLQTHLKNIHGRFS